MADDLDDDLWKATVGNGIYYTELVRDGSPRFSIENDGTTLTRTVLVKWEDLESRLHDIFKMRAERIAFVRGDDDVDFAYVAEVIDLAREAGVDRVGLLTKE